MASPRVMRALWRVGAAIDSVRVELHGFYDYERLRELVAYDQRAGSRTLALTTPVPCFLLLIALDALPLAPIEEGVARQTAAFWFRAAFCGSTMTFITIVLTTQSLPVLPMTNTRLWLISAFVGVALLPLAYLLARVIGFPAPFGVQLQTTPWVMLVVGSLYLCWRDTLRADQHARETLKQLLTASRALFTIIVVYTAFSCIFVALSSNLQNIISCLLPLVKIAFKNWVDAGLHHSPHLKPVFSVFNVDLFHAMFVAAAMQQTASGSALLILLGVDVVQSVIAVYEVHSVVRSVQRTKLTARRLSVNRPTPAPLQRRKTKLEANLAPLAYALYVLETSGRVRRRLGIEVRPRRNAEASAPQANASGSDATDTTSVSSRASPDITTQPARTAWAERSAKVMPSIRSLGIETATISDDHNDPELMAATSMLKILYMTEFYVLTEYVEVMVAVTYGVYLYTLSYLPNRVYYTQLATLSAEELRFKAERVLLYAALELLSLAVFCVAVDRVVERFSLVGQLGFVLEKHWRVAQTSLVVWILFIVQSTLQHFGTDYTFEFKWLRNQQPP